MRYPEAIDTYQRLSVIYPENEEYIRNIADSYWNLSKMDEAFIAYEKLLLFDEENSDILTRIGTIAMNLSDYESAVKYLNQAIDCGIPQFNTFYNLGLAYGNMKNYLQEFPF